MKFQQWPKRDPNKNYFMVNYSYKKFGQAIPHILDCSISMRTTIDIFTKLTL